ncbi:hypothetical protein JKP88DRAFT_313273 [Tribonema minus]|uniref:Uncharacterized protein n=1 Tax=Tribonema minus TaxID=303371 RepID=A0A835Z7N8_9STRA|nr:hypothetical protein JKP88DRAFT_313273 [Tribonema minus]
MRVSAAAELADLHATLPMEVHATAHADLQHLPQASAPLSKALQSVGTLLRDVKTSQAQLVDHVGGAVRAVGAKRKACSALLESTRRAADARSAAHERALADFLSCSSSHKVTDAAAHLTAAQASMLAECVLALGNSLTEHLRNCAAVASARKQIFDDAQSSKVFDDAQSSKVFDDAQSSKDETDAWLSEGQPWKGHGAHLKHALSARCAAGMRASLESLITVRVSPQFAHIAMPGTPAHPEDTAVATAFAQCAHIAMPRTPAHPEDTAVVTAFAQADCLRVWSDTVPELGARERPRGLAAVFAQADCLRAWSDTVPELGASERPADCIRAGYLHRSHKTRFARKWVRRWFELTRSGLFCWQAPGDEGYVAGTRTLLSHVGAGALGWQANVSDTEKRRYRIDITTFDRKTIALQAEGPYEFALWCEAFHRSQLPTSSLLSDYSVPPLPPKNCSPNQQSNQPELTTPSTKAPSPPSVRPSSAPSPSYRAPPAAARGPAEGSASMFQLSSLAPPSQSQQTLLPPATTPHMPRAPGTPGELRAAAAAAAAAGAAAAAAAAAAPKTPRSASSAAAAPATPKSAPTSSSRSAASATTPATQAPSNDSGRSGGSSGSAAAAAGTAAAGGGSRVLPFEAPSPYKSRFKSGNSPPAPLQRLHKSRLVASVAFLRESYDMCADCGAAEPSHVSVGLGVLVCGACAAAHTATGASQDLSEEQCAAAHTATGASQFLKDFDKGQCAAAHTATGASQTKALSSATLEMGDVFLALAIGNDRSNDLWEGDTTEVEYSKLSPEASDEQRQRYVTDKYTKSLFVAVDEAFPDERTTEQRLLSAADKNDVATALAALARLPKRKGAMAARDADGSTALHRAAAAGALEVACLLVNNGASVAAEDADGCVPRTLALRNSQQAMADYLQDAIAAIARKAFPSNTDAAANAAAAAK